MTKFIFILILFCCVHKFVNCFISSFSGAFMLLYSVLRTIDGMTENIQHISNSMDLSLQSFLSNQFLNNNNDKMSNPLFIGADYHGSVSPYELAFHPTISNSGFIGESIDKGNINYFQGIEKPPLGSSLIDVENVRIFEDENRVENIIACNSALIKVMDLDFANKQEMEINDEKNSIKPSEQFYSCTQMVSTELSSQIEISSRNELILAAKILTPLHNGEIQHLKVNDQNSQIRLEKSISSEIFHYTNNFQQTENTEFDLNSFRLYSYYTTHYLFQITSIFSMGISLHSQYRRKSKHRKLHLVK